MGGCMIYLVVSSLQGGERLVPVKTWHWRWGLSGIDIGRGIVCFKAGCIDAVGQRYHAEERRARSPLDFAEDILQDRRFLRVYTTTHVWRVGKRGNVEISQEGIEN